MLKLGRVTKVKVFFLVLVYVFNFDLFEFLAAVLEKGLLNFSLVFNIRAFRLVLEQCNLRLPLSKVG